MVRGVLVRGTVIRTTQPPPGRVVHVTEPPRSSTRPRIEELTPIRPRSAAPRTSATSAPTPSSRMVSSTPEESPSRSTQARAPGPAWRATLSRAAATAASTSCATRPSTTTGSAGTDTEHVGSFAGREESAQVDLALAAAQVDLGVGHVGCAGAGDEPPQRALLLGGEHRQLGRLAPDLVAAPVDVGERLEDAVVDDAGDALALVEPLALEEHLLLALEAAAGEVDGQPDEPAEEEEQHDVVDRRLGGCPHLDRGRPRR